MDTGEVTGGYAPSVPISVYRELATELKTAQATIEALTRHNQQLVRQNQVFRREIQQFVHASHQLGHLAGVDIPDEPPVISIGANGERDGLSLEPRALGRNRNSGDRPQGKTKLFTEQRDEFRNGAKALSEGQDLGNLWLVTTILLVVFTAFGAGFLIMRPLLGR